MRQQSLVLKAIESAQDRRRESLKDILARNLLLNAGDCANFKLHKHAFINSRAREEPLIRALCV